MRKGSLRLILGRAGSGKTEQCLNAYAREPENTCVILPTANAAERVRATLQARGVDADPERVIGWTEFLAQWAGGRARQVLEMNRRVALCARLCESLLSDDSFFGKVRHLPGFHLRLVQHFEAWSLDGLTADLLQRASELLMADEQLLSAYDLLEPKLQLEWKRKLEELARLWDTYRERLQALQVLDPSDLYSLALEGLRTHHRLPFYTCWLDGFWSMREMEFRVLEALLQRGVQVNLTLLYDPQRPALFVPTALLKERLEARFATETVMLPPPTSFEHEDLALLEANLFREGDERQEGNKGARSLSGRDAQATKDEKRLGGRAAEKGEETPSSPAIFLLDTPSLLAEIEVVARHILLLQRQGVEFGEIALVLRDPETYSYPLRVIAERYGIPLNLQVQERLTDNPLIQTVAELLRLLSSEWDVDSLFEWLRSAYVPVPKERLGRLRRWAHRVRLKEVSHLDAWLEKLVAEGFEVEARYLQEWFAYQRAVTHPPHSEAEGQEVLTPPSPPSHLAFLQQLIQALIFQGETSLIGTRRDQLALREAMEVARAQEEFAPPLPFIQWSQGLVHFWRESFYTFPVGEEGVQVLSVEEPEVGAPRVAFVMGLLEGRFPRRYAEDPFLREDERQALTATVQKYAAAFPELPHPQLFYLPLRHELSEAERFRFYRAVTVPRQRLFLSYPRAGQESEELPSFYLSDLQRAVGSGRVQTKLYRLAEVVPPLEEAITPYDQLLVAVSEWKRQASAPQAQNSSPSPSPFPLSSLPSYSSPPLLQHPEARAWVAKMDRPLSVTELESLAQCPFQHLARHRLNLTLPRHGLQSAQIGSLLHGVLQRGFAQAKPLPKEPQAMATLLVHHLDRLIAEQPPEVASWQLLVLREYGVRLLSAFAERESRYRTQFGLEPCYLEWAFGEEVGEAVEEEVSRPRDPSSRRAPLQIRLSNDRKIAVCGVVDRIDLDPQKQVAMIVDYKLDEVITKSQLEALSSFQMPLYARVVQEAFGFPHLVLAYETLSGERRYRIVPPQLSLRFRNAEWEGSAKEIYDIMPPLKWQELQRRVEQQLIDLVQLLQTAEVAPRQGAHCQHCPFGSFCRSDLAPEA